MIPFGNTAKKEAPGRDVALSQYKSRKQKTASQRSGGLFV
jgi:hypothetical protein